MKINIVAFYDVVKIAKSCCAINKVIVVDNGSNDDMGLISEKSGAKVINMDIHRKAHVMNCRVVATKTCNIHIFL